MIDLVPLDELTPDIEGPNSADLYWTVDLGNLDPAVRQSLVSGDVAVQSSGNASAQISMFETTLLVRCEHSNADPCRRWDGPANTSEPCTPPAEQSVSMQLEFENGGTGATIPAGPENLGTCPAPPRFGISPAPDGYQITWVPPAQALQIFIQRDGFGREGPVSGTQATYPAQQ
jgi:hypothetical protein